MKAGWLVLSRPGAATVGGPTQVVTTVHSGRAFVDVLRVLQPLLAIVSSPPAGPVEIDVAVAERRRRPGLRLIFVNEPTDGAGRLDALARGFDEALPASIDAVELAGRARLLVDGAQQAVDRAQRIAIAPDVVLDLVGGCVRRNGRDVRLRPKEYALLAMLASDPGRVFSRTELVGRIWGPSYRGAGRTVDVHIRWLRAKLEEVPDRPRHVVTVRGTGYRLDPPDR